MKMTIKVTLMFVLFVSTTFADGQMGSGGREGCTVNCPPPCTENCGRSEADLTVGGIKGGKSVLTIAWVRGVTKFYFGF